MGGVVSSFHVGASFLEVHGSLSILYAKQNKQLAFNYFLWLLEFN